MNILYKTSRTCYKSLQRLWGKTTQIGNFKLKLDPENSQPYIIKKYPEHGKSLVRLSQIMESKYGDISIFDVGANFGDTAAMLLSDNPKYKIICIEGDKEVFNFLTDNFSAHKNVSLHQNFIGGKNETMETSFFKTGGSLKLNNKSDIKNKIDLISLDTFINSHPEYISAKVLKIDTDGYDIQILRGAKNYLHTTHPAIYFEYDKEYLSENGESGLDIFDFLREYQYKNILFFDNYGRFLVSSDIENKALIEQLDRYLNGRRGGFAYYDLIAFHSSDDDICSSFIKSEESKD